MTRRVFALLGVSLALVCELKADRFPYHGRVVGIENLTHDTRRISFRVTDGQELQFTPGQYIFLKVPEKYVQAWNECYQTTFKEVARPYSFASSPSRLPRFDLIIKLVPAPPGRKVPPGLASTYVHTWLRIGDVVDFSAPMGNLALPNDSGRPIVIVAGGTGAAPFVSMLEYWFENPLQRSNEIYFFVGVRRRRDLFLQEQFQKWARTKKNFHYIPALSAPEPEDDWQGETGYIQTVVEKQTASIANADVYLAGPPIMVREAVKVLNAKGITRERIHFDPIEVR
jgi:Na+-transporting NADH:ubiquinone oxidoreductase subunit F